LLIAGVNGEADGNWSCIVSLSIMAAEGVLYARFELPTKMAIIFPEMEPGWGVGIGRSKFYLLYDRPIKTKHKFSESQALPRNRESGVT
jgi:hypothetical protein